MDIVIDTSAIVAVIVDEPERGKIIKLTNGNALLAPGSIPWEIGNAFSSMFKQGRFDLEEAKKGLMIFQTGECQVLPQFGIGWRLETGGGSSVGRLRLPHPWCGRRRRPPDSPSYSLRPPVSSLQRNRTRNFS